MKGKFGKEDEKAVDRMFVSRAMPINLPTGKRTSGFVFTNRDLGVKVVNVDLLGGGKSWQSSFIIDVPGIKLDVEKVDITTLGAIGDRLLLKTSHLIIKNTLSFIQ